ncbi:Uncharacterized protein OS=Planctomyces limnophilus (strain ATCC 43296 / DSM 3776 / IFAM 1008 / 290) GN=Plim_2418 PE=4 SV=1: DUF2306 [Gemmata massiliana]|uniref:DUF2306 domain-containing protein n=1 Tax=Gemmata massiliana TaxID=1210884 RepID=A0A6P2D455_9BACT|nr:DUF2306 domain-containing protein [Gemmata massiliana]VTR96088.1 Uncharacterized protein OS=Planctomyces limnophilus (strain ATCC 43296 / DSM 3776 / IFAM 1008 / 290) GN=Plim_2418 PE=4 SV=1: DUF2306 [Gemmata massiliana]
MRHRILATALRWLAAVLVVRVLVTILSNYPDYFPPDFDSLFLQGRESTFVGSYRPAFYVHILSSPFVLLNGLFLVVVPPRRRHDRLHRVLGRVQVVVLLALVLPSSVLMSRHAFGGWRAGLSFVALAGATATCAVLGVVRARRRHFDRHRRWMTRCFVLICSAVVLRLTSGAASVIGVPNPEGAYIVAAWCSWLVPLTVYELVERLPTRASAPVSR